MVNVCVSVMEGEIGRDVEVTLMTRDTDSGEFVHHCKRCFLIHLPALAGLDYAAVTMVVILTPAVPTNCTEITITGDSHPESTERFNVQLFTNIDQVNLHPDTVTVVIKGILFSD